MSGRIEMTEEELANLSDDELMNLSAPPVITGGSTTADEENSDQEEAGNDDGGVASGDGNGTDDSSPGSDGGGDEHDGDDTDPAAVLGAPDEGEGAPAKPDAKPVEKPAEKPADKPAAEAEKSKGEGAQTEAPVDYEAAYKKLMAPFKANGKEIRLDSPDDLIRLAQMGANYTKKMQALQPNLRLLKMLENHGLLDEGKLSLLIDIEKKNPAAIKKVVKDSGVDPMDIDTSVDPGYTPGKYAPSEEAMRLTSTIEEVASDPGGKQFIASVQRNWDKRSKDALWNDPGILRVLNTQRQTGIYDTVVNEIERRKTLGHIPEDTPFLSAYQTVGQEMDKAGLLKPKTAAPAAQPQPKPSAQPNGQQTQAGAQGDAGRKVLDQRTGVKPKASTVANSEKARAASPTKAATPGAKPSSDFNPLSMSDEDFEKNAALMRRL